MAWALVEALAITQVSILSLDYLPTRIALVAGLIKRIEAKRL